MRYTMKFPHETESDKLLMQSPNLWLVPIGLTDKKVVNTNLKKEQLILKNASVSFSTLSFI